MDVKLPQLAEGVESGTVVNILVKEGQEVKKDREGAVGQILISISPGGATQPSAPAGTNSQTHPAPQPAQRVQQQPVTPSARDAPAQPIGAYQYESKSGMPPPAPPSI